MHPERAAPTEIKAIVMGCSRGHEGLRHLGPVIFEGRCESMPVDHGRRICSVGKPNIESLGLVEIKAVLAGAVQNTEDRRRSSMHVDRSRAER